MPRPLSSRLKLLPIAIGAIVLVAGCSKVGGQARGDDAEARRARIAENLVFEVPQLQGAPLVVSELEPSGVEGLDRGTFSVGSETYPFLVTRDDTKLYLLAMEPFDASRTAEQLAEARAEAAAAAAAEARERAARLARVAEGLPMRGNPRAPVTIVEFSDFQCPYCRRAAGTVEEVLAKYPDEVRFAYLHFPLGNHPWARPAAIASVCAAEQGAGAFWTLHDRYFEEQGALTPENVVARSRAYLAGSGVDLARWQACAADPASEAYRAAAAKVVEMEALGREYGVTGTPAFFVNGVFLSGAQPLEAFEAAIAQARQATP